ncbi:hypothetical protein D9M68_431510 [compost metagenome]
MRGRFALQRTQSHLFLAGLCGLSLQRVQLLDELPLAQFADLGLVFQARQDLAGLAANLSAYAFELRFQCLQAWVAIQQCRRKVGNLPLQIRFGLLQPLDHLRADDVGDRVRRPAACKGRAHAGSACLRIGALAAHPGQLGRNIGQLPRREILGLAGRQQIGRRAVGGNLRFRIPHLLAQIGDLRFQPAGRLGIGVELGAALQRKEDLRHFVRNGGRELAVLRGEGDRDHAGLLDLIDLELVVEFLEHPLLWRHLQGVLLEAEHDEKIRKRRGCCRWIELLQLIELHIARDLLDEVRRTQHLHLAQDPGFVEDTIGAGLRRLIGAAELRLARFDQHAGFALIVRRNHLCRTEGECCHTGCCEQHLDAPIPDSAKQAAEVDIHILLTAAASRHAIGSEPSNFAGG